MGIWREVDEDGNEVWMTYWVNDEGHGVSAPCGTRPEGYHPTSGCSINMSDLEKDFKPKMTDPRWDEIV